MKRLSFKTQFKIEFLLPLTSCRKVLGKCLVLNSSDVSSLPLSIAIGYEISSNIVMFL